MGDDRNGEVLPALRCGSSVVLRLPAATLLDEPSFVLDAQIKGPWQPTSRVEYPGPDVAQNLSFKPQGRLAGPLIYLQL